MSYTVGEIARYAGLTVRTLHHYDEIGLLSPSGRSGAGYRLYDDADVDRLQQILFYRELGFSLEDIAAILDDPEADPAHYLERQRQLLTERIARLGAMVAVIERTKEARRMGYRLSLQEKLMRSGKVRDMYSTSGGILMVASDRISAYDVVLPTPIPDKGAVLTALSAFWFHETREIIPNHMISTSFADFPPDAQNHIGVLEGRTMLVRESKVVPVECVARGYITGSALKEYQATGSVCGIRLPEGLRESDELPEPIFTPTTKADAGHDEPLTFDQACDVAGRETMDRVRETTLALYRYAASRARERGIIVADTKFEFGIADDDLILIDEALTPDSSRFWPASEYAPGRSQPSFDKQYVRDWLDKIGWDREPPAPELPDEVVDQTRERYIEAYQRISGASFEGWRG